MPYRSICARAVAMCCMLSCSCSDDRLPCPPKGIGVEHVGFQLPWQTSPGECSGAVCWTSGLYGCTEGTDVCAQIANYKQFACGAPQACPDVGGKDAQFIPYRLDASSAGETAMFLVTNCSTGDTDLEISGVTIYGDERCSFSNVSDSDIGKKTLRPGETTAIRTTYTPRTVGEDHAELRVLTNAQNFPELRLRVCGAAQSRPTDAGVDGSTSSTLTNASGCEEKTQLVACHQR
jgi:hypothetical protein